MAEQGSLFDKVEGPVRLHTSCETVLPTSGIREVDGLIITAGAGMGQHGGGIDQMMQNSDAMMRSAEVMMRDLTAMPMAGQHGTLLTGMNGMLGQMRSMHGGLTTMMQDPAVMQNAGAMRSFNQASKNLEQMATAFNAMAKNMTSAMKGLPHGAR